MAVRQRRIEYWAGLGAVLTAAAIATARAWPVPEAVRGPVLNALLHDPVIIGVLRLAIVVAALYAIASVPALIVGGRWAKGIGSGGILADDVAAIPFESARLRHEIAELESQNESLIAERDELLSLVDDETRPH